MHPRSPVAALCRLIPPLTLEVDRAQRPERMRVHNTEFTAAGRTTYIEPFTARAATIAIRTAETAAKALMTGLLGRFG